MLWADISEPVLFEAPSPPAWQRKGYNELLSALVLATAPCLLTLLKHLDSEEQSW